VIKSSVARGFFGRRTDTFSTALVRLWGLLFHIQGKYPRSCAVGAGMPLGWHPVSDLVGWRVQASALVYLAEVLLVLAQQFSRSIRSDDLSLRWLVLGGSGGI
jgi:hypothetical protein